MVLLVIILSPFIYIFIKLVLYHLIKKYGKISYDGFDVAGFSYDPKKDIFYSTKNAWQKNFGYTHMYDVAAPFFQMIIDTEPVHFYYNGKNWLISFWKGQYGITTGAEIGVYNTSDRLINKNTLYMPVKNNELLNMSFVLYKDDKVITSIESKHWWLAVFKLGDFSNPENLVMDIKIEFLNSDMLDAFLNEFKKLKHKQNNYYIKGKYFYFRFSKQRSRKIWTRGPISDAIRQKINKRNVNLYNVYLKSFVGNQSDDEKIFKVNSIIPDIFKNKDKDITDRLINKNNSNVLLLQEDIFSNEVLK